VDLVVCNPPFFPPGNGRLNPNLQRAVARHEIELTLFQLIEASDRMLRDGGRFAAVYPVGRKEDVLSEMRRSGLEPTQLRLVRPKENGRAKLFLVEGVKGGRAALDVLPPLVLCRPDGSYTQEAASMFVP
jgi:tRNA1Val (adenine37-N6)-methyltransferase